MLLLNWGWIDWVKWRWFEEGEMLGFKKGGMYRVLEDKIRKF